ncbi:MAG: RidA family protein [Rikenellaceae bacterium]
MKRIITSPLAPKAVGPYSQAVEANGTLYVSGQIPVKGADGSVAEGIEAQTAQSLNNLKAILEEGGYSLADVVKTTVLLDSMDNFAAMNGVYSTFFTAQMPARVCYQVSKLPLGVLVEIDAIAAK